MRILTVTLSLAILCVALVACSSASREGIGARSSDNIVEGTGTINLNPLSADCSTVNACGCPLITVDGGGRLGATNLAAGFMRQDMRVRFRARITGQTYCGPGFDVADYAISVVEIVEIEPR